MLIHNFKINTKIKTYEDITHKLYEGVTEENYRNFIKGLNSKFLIFTRSLMLFIILLIPSSVLPIASKIFSKKIKTFNKTKHDLKFILYATPKKYVLKICAKNILRIFKNG